MCTHFYFYICYVKFNKTNFMRQNTDKCNTRCKACPHFNKCPVSAFQTYLRIKACPLLQSVNKDPPLIITMLTPNSHGSWDEQLEAFLIVHSN